MADEVEFEVDFVCQFLFILIAAIGCDMQSTKNCHPFVLFFRLKSGI